MKSDCLKRIVEGTKVRIAPWAQPYGVIPAYKRFTVVKVGKEKMTIKDSKGIKRSVRTDEWLVIH